MDLLKTGQLTWWEKKKAKMAAAEAEAKAKEEEANIAALKKKLAEERNLWTLRL